MCQALYEVPSNNISVNTQSHLRKEPSIIPFYDEESEARGGEVTWVRLHWTRFRSRFFTSLPVVVPNPEAEDLKLIM